MQRCPGAETDARSSTKVSEQYKLGQTSCCRFHLNSGHRI